MANYSAAANVQAAAVAAFLTSIAVHMAESYGITVTPDTQAGLVGFVTVLAAHIVGSQAVQLVDLVTQRLPTDERVVPQFEVFGVGESLVIGIRNRTGAGVTPQLEWYYTDEPA